MMQWGQRANWVIFGILETYNESRQLYVYISGISGKSFVTYDSNEVLYA